MELFGLTEQIQSPRVEKLERTVFIAHRFDERGQEADSKVARFLELLGFRVVTGRGFAPTPIAEKVKGRLTSQAIVIAILTTGDDSTWLVQESLLANLGGKPLFLLKEEGTSFKPGLLADVEYIPFESHAIEKAFIPLLEGLRELKLQAFEEV